MHTEQNAHVYSGIYTDWKLDWNHKSRYHSIFNATLKSKVFTVGLGWKKVAQVRINFSCCFSVTKIKKPQTGRYQTVELESPIDQGRPVPVPHQSCREEFLPNI